MRPGRGYTRPSGYGQSPSGPKGSWWKLCAEKPLVGTLFTDTCATFFMRRARCAAGRISRVPVRELLSNCVHATCGATLAVHPLLLLIKACARAVVGNFIVKRQRCAATPQRRDSHCKWPF